MCKMDKPGNFSQNTSRVMVIIKLDEDQFSIFLNVSITLCIVISLCILMLIGMFIWDRRLRTGSGILILHQLIIEIQHVAIHWPIFIWMLATSQYRGIPQTPTFCQYYHFIYMTTMTASLWALTFLALNRFAAIYLPFHYSRFVSKPALATMILLIWIIGAGTHIPFLLGVEGGFVPVPPSGICSFHAAYNPNAAVIYNLTNLPRTYLPLVLSALFYLLVFTKVGLVKLQRTTAAPDQTSLSTQSQSVSNRTVKRETYQNRVAMARLLFVNSILHCIFFLANPIGVAIAPKLYREEPAYRNWLRTLLFIGYWSTPVLLLAMSKAHRDSLKQMVRRSARVGITLALTSREKMHIPRHSSQRVSTRF